MRRGAWYRVSRLTAEVAMLEVGQRSVSVPRELLTIALVRPRHWSVVRRPYDAVDVPRNWGARYGVCPACQHRMPLDYDQVKARCDRCGAAGAIAWHETM